MLVGCCDYPFFAACDMSVSSEEKASNEGNKKDTDKVNDKQGTASSKETPKLEKGERCQDEVKGNKENEVAVLPMEMTSTVSEVVSKNLGKTGDLEPSLSSTGESGGAGGLPTLTLSVMQSNLKQTLPPSIVQTSAPETKDSPLEATLSSSGSKGVVHKTKTSAASPMLPSFTQTIDPKYMPGSSSTGLFGRAKEKSWKVTLFGGRSKTVKKDHLQTPDAKENSPQEKDKNKEGTM